MITTRIPRVLSNLALLGVLALALAPLGCDGGDDGDDEVAEETDGTESADTMDTADTGPDLENGQTIHDGLCAIQGCHGATDTIKLSERVPTLDDTALEEQIRTGGNGMPAFSESQISAEDMVDLIAYLRDLYG